MFFAGLTPMDRRLALRAGIALAGGGPVFALQLQTVEAFGAVAQRTVATTEVAVDVLQALAEDVRVVGARDQRVAGRDVHLAHARVLVQAVALVQVPIRVEREALREGVRVVLVLLDDVERADVAEAADVEALVVL